MRDKAFMLIGVLLVASTAGNGLLFTLYLHSTQTDDKLEVWNVSDTIPPDGYLFSSMFDTFKMKIDLKANSTLVVYVFTPTQYAQFERNIGFVSSYVAKYSGTQISFEWNLSTGCAGYLWVVYNPSPVTVHVEPNVVAQYDPSPVSTGVCTT